MVWAGAPRGRWTASLVVAAAVGLVTLGGQSARPTLVMDDFSFTPSTLRLPAATVGVTLVLSNAADQPHDLTVEDLPDDVPVHLLLFEDAHDVPYLLPPLPAGTYPIRCSLPGHAEAGMVGTMIVD